VLISHDSFSGLQVSTHALYSNYCILPRTCYSDDATQLSRQLVHLRERQQELRETLETRPNDTATARLEEDIERAVLQLQARVRKLLAEHQSAAAATPAAAGRS
jgi:hypothetical protein